MFVRVMIAFIVLLVAMSGSASAERVFDGWSRQTGRDNVMGLLSPKDGNGQAVAFFIRAPEAMAGTPASWFAGNVEWFAGKAALMTGRSGMRRAQEMMLETGHYRRHDGIEIDILVAAYPVSNGQQQLMAIIYPSVVPDSDPRIIYAIDFLATAYRTRYEMRDFSTFDQTAPTVVGTTVVSNNAPPPVSSAPQQQPAVPQTQGKNCARKPIWGLRVSPWCQPSGVCNDLWIKDYETVCE